MLKRLENYYQFFGLNTDFENKNLNLINKINRIFLYII